MKYYLKVIIFLLFSGGVIAQGNHWISAGIPLYNYGVWRLFNDTSQNDLYAVGRILNTSISWQQQSICKYNGNTWDTIGVFNDQVRGIVKFNGEIIVGGYFNEINGQAMTIARYDGVTWHSMGIANSYISNIRIINDSLYVMGAFTQIDSINMVGIAKWNGTQWTDVFGFKNGAVPGAVSVSDAVEYNNEIYVGGNFNDPNGLNDLVVFSSGIWQNVGQGLFGSFTNINSLIVFQNELYAGGSILKNAGNIGHGIQKWNGISWSAVGTGLQDMNNSYNGFVQLYQMAEYKNELYVTGAFYFAGNIPAFCAAKWDGQNWCGLGTSNELSYNTRALAFYNDTLFLSYDGDSLNGSWVNRLIKCSTGVYIDSCSVVGIDDVTYTPNSFLVYPNPAKDKITVYSDLQDKENTTLQIFNFRGELMLIFNFDKLSREKIISLTSLSSGIYSMCLTGPKYVVTRKFIVE